VKFVLFSPSTPPLVGGLENVCLWLARQLRDDGHTVSIVGRFATTRPGLRGRFLQAEQPRRFILDGIPVSILPPLAGGRAGGAATYALMQSPATLPLACRLQAKSLGAAVAAHCQGADAVHYLGTGLDMLGFMAETAARQAGATFSVEPAIHIGRWGDRWIDAALYHRADAVLAYSACEAETILGLGVSPDRLHRVHCRCDLGDGGDAAAFRSKHAIRGPIVLFLGRKTEAKGVRRLLAAWPAVRRHVPDASVVVMGPSEGKCLIGTGEGIVDIDDADEAEKQNALAACDLLCVPSDGESFGLVYYEAWNYAKPVVGLDQPALRETVGASGGGLLVQPAPQAIGAAIARLLGDAARREVMGRRGHRFARRHLEHDTYRDYREAFNAAARNGGGRRQPKSTGAKA
jgi:glycosyltransferase involved in cell wall biosynthesis